MFLLLAHFHCKFCSYITMPIFTLKHMISSTVGGRLHLPVTQWSQRWELMGCNTKNSMHAGLVSGELSLGFRDRALRSCKKGSAWLVCYYWPTDVKVSVTCLVKRKKFECRRDRGLLCNQLYQWLIISKREISWHTEGLSEPPTLHIYLSFSPPSYFLCCSFCCLYILFSDSLPSTTPSLFPAFPFTFSSSCLISPILNILSCFQVSSTSLILLVSLQPVWDFALFYSDVYNCRVELNQRK